jgi:hypothetical protein
MEMAKFTTEYVFDTATHISGMTKNEIVCFLLFNPNGLVAKLPSFDDFCHGDVFFTGCEMLYGRHDNYQVKWLRSVCHKEKSYTKWQLMYHLGRLADDADEAWTVIADKKAAA